MATRLVMQVDNIEPYFDGLRRGEFILDASKMQNVSINLNKTYSLAWGCLGSKGFGQAVNQTAESTMILLLGMSPQNFVYIEKKNGVFIR